MSKGITIKGMEIFATGMHRDKTYTADDLDDLVANFNRFSRGVRQSGNGTLSVPLVIGHDEDQELLQRTDLPAAGWFTRIWRAGDKLKADVEGVPEEIAALIESQRYRKVSAEVYDKPPQGLDGGKGRTLRRVVILGGEIPQIKNLADIPMPRRMSERPLQLVDVRCDGTGCYRVFFEEKAMTLSPIKRAALALLLKGKACDCHAKKFAGTATLARQVIKKAPLLPRSLTRAAKGIGSAIKAPFKGLKRITAQRELDRFVSKRSRAGSALRAAALLGAAAVLSRTRAARMLGKRGNRLANKAARTVNRGHALLRKRYGLKFCDRGPNAGKPGPCPGLVRKGKVGSAALRSGLKGAGLAALAYPLLGRGIAGVPIRTAIKSKGYLPSIERSALLGALLGGGRQYLKNRKKK